MFPWDLKVSHFQSSNTVSQWGRRHTKDCESKCIQPPCFANSVSQISNNTGSLQHHREVSNGLLHEDIKSAAEKQTGVRVSFQIQTVRISCWILSSDLPARWKQCVALHFLAKQNSQSENGQHPAPLTTPWQLSSAMWCKCKWHIRHG